MIINFSSGSVVLTWRISPFSLTRRLICGCKNAKLYYREYIAIMNKKCRMELGHSLHHLSLSKIFAEYWSLHNTGVVLLYNKAWLVQACKDIMLGFHLYFKNSFLCLKPKKKNQYKGTLHTVNVMCSLNSWLWFSNMSCANFLSIFTVNFHSSCRADRMWFRCKFFWWSPAPLTLAGC